MFTQSTRKILLSKDLDDDNKNGIIGSLHYKLSQVRESIAYAYMDFQKIHGYYHRYPGFLDVGLQLSIQVGLSAHRYPSRDIHKMTFSNGYPSTINIHEWMPLFLWISVFNYSCFFGYPFGYPLIFTDIHLNIL